MEITKEALKYLSFFVVSFFTLSNELAKASDICVPYFSARRQLERTWMSDYAFKMLPKLPQSSVLDVLMLILEQVI